MHITSRTGTWIKLLPAILITVLIIITQTGCGEKDPVSKSDFCLDTTCDIKLYDMGLSLIHIFCMVHGHCKHRREQDYGW